MQEKPLLKPKIDLVFKTIFGNELNKEILESFLKAVLSIPSEDKINIAILDPSTKSEKENDKTAIIDVRVETNGEIINVEIQLDKDPSMEDRIVYGISKTVTNQKFKGDNYKLKKVVAIVITGYKLIETHEYYHDIFNYHSEKTGHTFSKSTEIHTLELKKLPDIDDGTMLWNWIKFIKSEERSDFEMLAQKNEVVSKAVTILKEISQDEKLRQQAYNREMAQLRERAMVIEAKKEAKAEGELKKAKETTIELLKMGLDIDMIAKAVKMPVEWVQDLKNELNIKN